jgi:hypothetical protein
MGARFWSPARATQKGMNMAALVKGVDSIEASAQNSSYGATPAAIKSNIVDFWPQTIVAVGVGLSVVWAAGLLWLLYVIV